jgi:hypothetical protein
MITPILSQCAQTARELLTVGLVPLPVAPAYPVEQYKTKKGEPLFTGKNPSYITAAGKPEAIGAYKEITAAAAADKFDKWFADPRVGVGTCSRQWLDIDLKDFDFDVAAMERSATWGNKAGNNIFTLPLTAARSASFLMARLLCWHPRPTTRGSSSASRWPWPRWPTWGSRR